MKPVTLDVVYGQLAVFDARLSNPFNDWSDAHVAQGFTWRPGSVSFSTLHGDGSISVTIKRTETPERLETRTERAIAVPFTVPAHGEIEIATICQSTVVQLPPGEYQLIFEHGRVSDVDMSASLTFRAVDTLLPPSILVADAALDPPAVFVMNAKPA